MHIVVDVQDNDRLALIGQQQPLGCGSEPAAEPARAHIARGECINDVQARCLGKPSRIAESQVAAMITVDIPDARIIDPDRNHIFPRNVSLGHKCVDHLALGGDKLGRECGQAEERTSFRVAKLAKILSDRSGKLDFAGGDDVGRAVSPVPVASTIAPRITPSIEVVSPAVQRRLGATLEGGRRSVVVAEASRFTIA